MIVDLRSGIEAERAATTPRAWTGTPMACTRADWSCGRTRALRQARTGGPAQQPEAGRRHEAIDIGDFVYAATGDRVRRLTTPDGTQKRSSTMWSIERFSRP